MRKGKTVIGQDIYSVSSGIRVESVKDLVLEDGEDGVVALLVSDGGLFGTSRVVPFSSVVRFGPSAVMIDDADSAIPAASDPRVAEIVDRKGSLPGRRVVTEDGQELGRIGDVYFDEGSGRITGYEVSAGLLGDATRGTSYLPFEDVRVVGRDAVIAADSATTIPGEQGGRPAAPGRGVSTGSDQGPAAEGRDGAGGPSDGAAADPDAALVGTRAQTDLMDRDGSVVIASGQTVTPELLERARAENNLDPLYQAVGRPRPGALSDTTGEALSKAADTAADLWGRFTTRMSEMTDAAGQRVDAQQTKARLDAINDAIGRPVTKVFLDRDDSVILDLGDLVTHQAVQRADDAGLLDSLLGSVYKAPDVSFSRDEMRAEIAGDSTVDKASGGASIVDDLTAKVDEATAKHDAESTPAAGEPKTGNGRPTAARQDMPGDPAPGQTIGQHAERATGSKRH